jgi:hypothetical protein
MAGLLTPNAERQIEAMLRKHHQPPSRQVNRRDDPWVFMPGQPVPYTNHSASPCPPGGLLQLDGTAGSDADHQGATQPLYPGISATLLVDCGDGAAAAGAGHAGDGLAWSMDGCVHPIADPLGVCVVGQRISAQGGLWTPMLFGLGPITITEAANVNGLAMGLCHGERGDVKLCVDGAGKLHVGMVYIWGTNYTVSYSAAGVPDIELAG